MRLAVAVIGILVLAAPVSAQSLGEAAEREKERQEKLRRNGGAAKVVTEAELKANPGRIANDPTIPPAVPIPSTPLRTGSRTVAAAPAAGRATSAVSPSSPGGLDPTRGSELGWRSAVRAARQNIARLEKEVAELDGKANRLAYGVATESGPPVVRGRAVYYESPRDRMAREGANAAKQQAWQKERADVLDRLQRARAELVKAKVALETLEESARRQGIPPGWLRE